MAEQKKSNQNAPLQHSSLGKKTPASTQGKMGGAVKNRTVSSIAQPKKGGKK